MTADTTPALRYDPFSQALHWLTALTVIGAFATAQIFEEMAKGPAKTELVGLHISVGVLVMALTLIRFAWQMAAARPTPLPGSPWLQYAARAMHWALYAALIAVPLTGMVMVWAKGREVGVFGLFALPPLVAPDREFAHTVEELHEFAGNLIIVLAGLHAAAAIFHQTVLRDGALGRMLPGVRAAQA
ncbi:cytochrome b [Blastochloris tepida]|uniref:Cytochrome b n=1 Tax=Blastochloris tepida TaxID=2233851 RepID=A0A348G2D9_9HYPH|nr:cytochrome b [Blastochloris tepida]BBF93722.1 cytochrome b [Blastochloris tepida]